MKLAIAIPTYNEALSLGELLPAIKKEVSKFNFVQTEVFIIDDNSPDKTAQVANLLAKSLNNRNFKVTVINREKKEGLGAAYIYGFEKILKQKFDYILQMDADLSHQPQYIPLFIQGTTSADFIVGSRYVKGGQIQGWSITRRILSVGGNLYSCLFLGTRIKDYTGGFNLYSSDLLRSININTLDQTGYGFLIQLKYRALKNCHMMLEIPIVFRDRLHGESKIPKNTIIRNFILVPLLRIKKQ